MIDELLASARHGAEMTVPGSWGQGRTVFGGLSAALMNQAMTHELPDSRALRVCSMQFIGPLLVDRPFAIQVEHLRDGKNVTQLQARLVQDGQVAALATAAFGAERASKLHVPAAPLTTITPPKKANWIPQIPKIVPRFHRYIDLKIEQGGMPFSGKKQSDYTGWMRFSEPPAVVDDAHLIALIDVWPPTVLQMLKWPAPASTLSWKIQFASNRPQVAPEDWLAYRAETSLAADGYGHTEANIYAADGSLLAISRQTVTVFD